MTTPSKTLWQSDPQLFDLARRELFTAVVGDVMDKLGLQRQFLSPQIQPLRDDMIVLGRAMPVLEADVFAENITDSVNPLMQKSFGLMLEALDDLQSGEVYICTGASPAYALWGELMSTRAMKLGAAGAVVDGYSRDTRGILALNFPVFSHGRYAQDQGPRGKVIDFRCPIANHDQVLITGVAGKFDIGGFGVVQNTPTPDQKLDFVVRVTDGDGDFATAGFSIGIDGTGIFDDDDVIL